MSPESDITRQLRAELDETRLRLTEAQEALDAIRNGEVDGLMMAGPAGGQQVFTLQGAQEPYRLLIEQMSEGAVTLSREGLILYANPAVARLLQLPLERVIGAEFRTFVGAAEHAVLAGLIEAAWGGSSRGEVSVCAADGSSVPMRLGLSRLKLDSETLVCAVATDLTEVRKKDEELARLHTGLEQRVGERTADLATSRLAALSMMEEAVEARQSLEAANRLLTQEMDARQRTEAELALAHRDLLEVSRQAGMAEVATSVLHNVGNVLNSVSISAELVAGKVRQPQAGSLQRVAELLRAHAADLPAFLSHDPQGRALPDYLLKLVTHLGEPPQGVLQELESLRKNIEHIKGIVAQQQRHARGTGVLEELALAGVVEDALAINAAGFSRHEVRVEREFAPVPPVLTDRHQVLQVLVNLVNNAKYALERTPGEKRLTVRLGPNGADGVKIEVADNGIGIAPEGLARIFQHGYTTKQDGHGFGLHSGALAAKQLGGRLTVHSEGVGRGATFTLELPVRHQPEHP